MTGFKRGPLVQQPADSGLPVQQMLLMASPRVQQHFLKLTPFMDQVSSGADDTNVGAFHSHTSATFFPLLPLNKKQYCSVYSNMLQYVHT